MTSALGTRRAKFWEDEGFLVLPGFLSEAEVEAISDCYARTWEERTTGVVVDDLMTGRRSLLTEVRPEDTSHNFKVNDLYLIEAALREIALSERLGVVLEELLADEPVLVNTLNFNKGSTQADHLDTLYMTPRSDLALVATWLAIEDAVAEAGPLRYWPGSNHIAPYRFSTGSMHVVEPEMPQWSDYVATETDRHGLTEERFLAKKGDLFIWHAGLLHGGCRIEEPALTRQSLVSHYWTQSDCEAWNGDLRPAPGGWWMKKPHLATGTGAGAAGAAGAAPEVAPPPLMVAPEAPEPDLRERLDALLGARD